jgi:hypothetical protein
MAKHEAVPRDRVKIACSSAVAATPEPRVVVLLFQFACKLQRRFKIWRLIA